MPVIDKSQAPIKAGAIYPEPYAAQMAGRSSLRLGQAGGLTQFGVNEVILAPGAVSSLRHWHHREDEFVMMLQGEAVLIQDEGEHVMRPGDCAAFPAGDSNGHHFINRTSEEARFLVIGSKMDPEHVSYSDVDLELELTGGAAHFTYRDGTEHPMRRTK